MWRPAYITCVSIGFWMTPQHTHFYWIVTDWKLHLFVLALWLTVHHYMCFYWPVSKYTRYICCYGPLTDSTHALHLFLHAFDWLHMLLTHVLLLAFVVHGWSLVDGVWCYIYIPEKLTVNSGFMVNTKSRFYSHFSRKTIAFITATFPLVVHSHESGQVIIEGKVL